MNLSNEVYPGRKGNQRRGEVVSFVMNAPSVTPDNAGEEYVAKHYEILHALGFGVTSVGEVSDINRRAQTNPRPGTTGVLLVPRTRFATTIAGRVINRIANELWRIRTNSGYSRALCRSDTVASLLRNAAFVEIQWVEFFGLWRQVRAVAPGTPLLGVVHDVVSQRVSRQVGFDGQSKPRTRDWLRHPLAALMLSVTVQRERTLCRHFDLLLTFSDKDTQILRDIGVRVPVMSVAPNLETPAMSAIRNAARPRVHVEQCTVLFVGAFRRQVNQDGATWLLREIWPIVNERLGPGSCRLVIAGADPTAEMFSAADEFDNVEITGFVESLDPLYTEAHVAVAPLRYGAGLKFKSVTAMLWGLPLVTTSVGFEGIHPPIPVECVSDSAEELASAIVRVANDPASANRRASEVMEWARDVYGEDAFRKSLDIAVSRLLGECEADT